MTQLDPRTKLVLLVLYIAMVSLATNWLVVVIWLGALLIRIIADGRLWAWLALMRSLTLLIATLFVFYLIAFDPLSASTAALKLAASASAFFLFFQATVPEDLGNALVQSRVPYSFVFVLVGAMQYAPVLSTQAGEILDAQRARGIELELNWRRPLAAARNLPVLFAPLLVQAFTIAEQLAEAMEARGFGAPHRSFAREYQLGRRDYIVLAASITAAIGLLSLYR